MAYRNTVEALKLLGEWSKWLTALAVGSFVFGTNELKAAIAKGGFRAFLAGGSIVFVLICLLTAGWVLVSIPSAVQTVPDTGNVYEETTAKLSIKFWHLNWIQAASFAIAVIMHLLATIL